MNSRTLRSPFLRLVEAAFFLQVPMYTAQRLHEVGELPEPATGSGELFRPTRSVVIDAIALRRMLPEEARNALDLWQRGRLEIPAPPARNARPVALTGVLEALAVSDRVGDRPGEGRQ